MIEVCSEKLPSAEKRDPRQWLYAAVLHGEDGLAIDQSLYFLLPYRKLAMPTPSIKITKGNDGLLEVSSPVFAHAVHTEDHGHELISDNWFDLLPGIPARVRVAAGHDPESIRLQAVMPALERQ
jgi:hypothetical protein